MADLGMNTAAIMTTGYIARQTIEFDAFTEYGKRWYAERGLALVNGRAWAFVYHGAAVVDENDDSYLVGTSPSLLRFERGDLLVWDGTRLHVEKAAKQAYAPCESVSCTLCASEPDQPAQAPQGDSTARMLALNVGTEQRSNPKKRRKLRDLAGYDPNPPVCRQCTNFRPAQEGNPASKLRPMVPYIPAHCAKHHFTTQPLAVCDDWQHKVTRETLR